MPFGAWKTCPHHPHVISVSITYLSAIKCILIRFKTEGLQFIATKTYMTALQVMISANEQLGKVDDRLAVMSLLRGRHIEKATAAVPHVGRVQLV